MPVDEIIGEVMAKVAGQVVGVVVDSAVELIASDLFRGWLARYFHGIGRRLIAAVTLGRVRIPSSLRVVPIGTQPKPTASDWIALGVGVIVWLLAAGLVIGSMILW
jgi:hypothetical protein